MMETMVNLQKKYQNDVIMFMKKHIWLSLILFVEDPWWLEL